MSEFKNLERLPWKFGNADFEVQFDPKALGFCCQTAWKSQSNGPTIFFYYLGIWDFWQVSMETVKNGFWCADT